jgi:hypothetical protein
MRPWGRKVHERQSPKVRQEALLDAGLMLAAVPVACVKFLEWLAAALGSLPAI